MALKTLRDLQNEIRLVRRDIQKMDKRLSVIENDLFHFEDVNSDVDSFKHIYRLAENMPLLSHPIMKESQTTKSIYFAILLMIASIEGTISDQQLLFLQRMVMTDKSCKRIDNYMSALGRLQPENIFYKLDNEVIVSHAQQLVLDMVIIAKIGDNCSDKSLKMIVDIAGALNINKNCFSEICDVARAIIVQDCSVLINNYEEVVLLNERFGYYLTEINEWEKYIQETLRKHLCCIICAIEVMR